MSNIRNLKCKRCGVEFQRELTQKQLNERRGGFCSHKCSTIGNQGGKKTWFKTKDQHPFWQGGRTYLLSAIRGSKKYRAIRNFVFRRDNYTCQKCGDRTRVGNRITIQMEHIKPLSHLVKENGVKTKYEALKCWALWDLENLITLCVPCHKKTDTWGGKALKGLRLTKIKL